MMHDDYTEDELQAAFVEHMRNRFPAFDNQIVEANPDLIGWAPCVIVPIGSGGLLAKRLRDDKYRVLPSGPYSVVVSPTPGCTDWTQP